jgi:hypothetical protein
MEVLLSLWSTIQKESLFKKALSLLSIHLDRPFWSHPHTGKLFWRNWTWYRFPSSTMCTLQRSREHGIPTTPPVRRIHYVTTGFWSIWSYRDSWITLWPWHFKSIICNYWLNFWTLPTRSVTCLFTHPSYPHT